MKPVQFLGDSLEKLRGFPEDARHDAGYQFELVQRGEQPDDFKPMPDIGKRGGDSGAGIVRDISSDLYGSAC